MNVKGIVNTTHSEGVIIRGDMNAHCQRTTSIICTSGAFLHEYYLYYGMSFQHITPWRTWKDTNSLLIIPINRHVILYDMTTVVKSNVGTDKICEYVFHVMLLQETGNSIHHTQPSGDKTLCLWAITTWLIMPHLYKYMWCFRYITCV